MEDEVGNEKVVVKADNVVEWTDDVFDVSATLTLDDNEGTAQRENTTLKKGNWMILILNEINIWHRQEYTLSFL